MGIKICVPSNAISYVDSSMDVVIFLSWQSANSEYVHRLYGIRVESYAKHMILDL
jgi:hypothetical protein